MSGKIEMRDHTPGSDSRQQPVAFCGTASPQTETSRALIASAPDVMQPELELFLADGRLTSTEVRDLVTRWKGQIPTNTDVRRFFETLAETGHGLLFGSSEASLIRAALSANLAEGGQTLRGQVLAVASAPSGSGIDLVQPSGIDIVAAPSRYQIWLDNPITVDGVERQVVYVDGTLSPDSKVGALGEEFFGRLTVVRDGDDAYLRLGGVANLSAGEPKPLSSGAFEDPQGNELLSVRFAAPSAADKSIQPYGLVPSSDRLHVALFKVLGSDQVLNGFQSQAPLRSATPEERDAFALQARDGGLRRLGEARSTRFFWDSASRRVYVRGPSNGLQVADVHPHHLGRIDEDVLSVGRTVKLEVTDLEIDFQTNRGTARLVTPQMVEDPDNGDFVRAEVIHLDFSADPSGALPSVPGLAALAVTGKVDITLDGAGIELTGPTIST